MKELYDIIERFQNLKEITGTNKSSSYEVTISFNPWDDRVIVELGGYEVGGWSRHEYLYTDRESLIKDLNSKVDDAVSEVTRELEEEQ